jgi:hypothetical protein
VGAAFNQKDLGLILVEKEHIGDSVTQEGWWVSCGILVFKKTFDHEGIINPEGVIIISMPNDERGDFNQVQYEKFGCQYLESNHDGEIGGGSPEKRADFFGGRIASWSFCF